MTRDLTLGCITLTVAGAYYAAASLLPQSQLDDAVGPGGLPKTYGVVLAVLSLLLVGSSRVDLQACKLEYSIVSPK